MTHSVRLNVIVSSGFTTIAGGGEAILPWHYFTRLRAVGVDAYLITHGRHERELTAEAPELVQWMRFTPDRRIGRVLRVLGKVLPTALRPLTVLPIIGMITNRDLKHLCRDLARSLPGPTVVHQPVPVSPRKPSSMADVGAPVVIGPMNGGMTYPPGFRGQVSRVERILRAIFVISAGIANVLVSGKRSAALLLVANERTRDALPASVARTPTLELVENAVDLSVFPFRPHHRSTRHFAYVGRLVGWKRVDLLIAALASTPHDYELHICGSGESRAELESAAQQHGVGDRVTFHGQLSQAECAEVLATCDALLLSSIYECGGAVVLEAMASGLPVVATDWGGPQEYLNSETGILVPPTSPETMVEDFSAAMRRLGDDPELIRTFGEAGRARVETHFSWDQKIEQVRSIYESCVTAESRVGS